MESPANPTRVQLSGWLPKPDQIAAALPPLSLEERSDATQLARRLQGELREVIGLLPEPSRNASSMSRSLELDRATCQRIVSVCATNDASAELLVNLPGVQGVRQFIAAVARRIKPGSGVEVLASANASADQFETVLDRLAGSQRRLKARFLAGAPTLESAASMGLEPDAPADDAGLRETLFRAASALVGRWSQLTVDTRLVWPALSGPEQTDGARIRGLIGHVEGPSSVPLETGETSSARALDGNSPAFATLDARPASGATPQSLLVDFCSRPLPRVMSRASGSRSVHTLDLEGPHGASHDLVMAHRNAVPDSHPATQSPHLGEIWWLATFPTRRVQFDVLMHQDVLREATVALEVHLWGPEVGRPGTTRWSTRFPGGPKAELLGSGLKAFGESTYERYGQLLASVFDQIGQKPSEFVGFRCEVAYPIWRSGYCVRFDYSEHGNAVEGA